MSIGRGRNPASLDGGFPRGNARVGADAGQRQHIGGGHAARGEDIGQLPGEIQRQIGAAIAVLVMLVAGEGPAERFGDRAHGEPGALAEELEAAGSLGGF